MIYRRIPPSVVLAWLAPAILALSTHSAVAQSKGVRVTGKLTHAVTAEPIKDATVLIEELRLQGTTAADGTYLIENVPPGNYHLLAVANGFTPKRLEIVVDGTAKTLDAGLDPELHYTEVVSVSPDARDQFDSYQPTSVLAGQDLAIHMEQTLGAALEDQAGVATRSFGPGPSRPIIRGLDGDRVLILEDGQPTGDLSSQSADHGVAANPAAATRLEVVRGPATLLYGSNAIGGLVNVINELIPTKPHAGVTSLGVIDFGSNAGEFGGAGDVAVGMGSWNLRLGGSGRRSGNYDTPEGEIDNSQTRSGIGQAAVSYANDKGYFGGSYQYDDSRYGIPFVESGEVELTPRRHSYTFQGASRQLDAGFIEGLRGSLAVRRYKHDEVDAGVIGTRFKNNLTTFDVLATQKARGRLTGSIGGYGIFRAFDSQGEEALSPPVDQNGFALFGYEEMAWSHATLQFGARFQRMDFSPEGGLPARDFDDLSASLGLLLRPTDATTIAVSLARAARNPALEELYFFGPHPGNFAFEIGNPDLDSEVGYGIDLSFRWRMPRGSGEVTYFRNAVNDFIFRDPLTLEEFIAGYDPSPEDIEAAIELPPVRFSGADALLQGVEFHTDFALTSTLTVEMTLDYVRGQLLEGDEPLPRIPPFRAIGGLKYQKNAFQGGFEVTGTAKQDRVFRDETTTAGYGLLKLYGSYSFPTGKAVSTITARLDNATNELYRNHLSYIKDFVPEMGRNFKVIYNIKF